MEFGWGPRPDGYTLHLTEEDANEYRSKREKRSLTSKYYREIGDKPQVLTVTKAAHDLVESKLNKEAKAYVPSREERAILKEVL